MTVTPAVISPSTSTGDAIPLMVSSTSGRNNSASFRDGLITDLGLPALSSGDAFPRPGVLGRVASSVTGANGVNSLFVHAPATPSGLQFVVESGSAIVVSSGASGAYLVNSKTALTLTLDPANASNPRIDLVYLQVSDILSSASATLVQIAVVTGTPGSTPTTPSLPTASTGVQYLTLGSIRVPAAATNLTSATFADLRVGTTINSLPRPLLGGDLASGAGAVPGETRVRLHSTYGTMVDFAGYDGLWHGTKSISVDGVWAAGATSNIPVVASGPTTVMTVTIPDPGWAYTYRVSACTAVFPSATTFAYTALHEGAVTNPSLFSSGNYGSTGGIDVSLSTKRSAVKTGSLVLYLDVTMFSGTTGNALPFNSSSNSGTFCGAEIFPA